jgi:hypothetical protein
MLNIHRIWAGLTKDIEGGYTTSLEKVYLVRLAVFRCLIRIAMESRAITNGMIANQDNSGTVGDEVRFILGSYSRPEGRLSRTYKPPTYRPTCYLRQNSATKSKQAKKNKHSRRKKKNGFFDLLLLLTKISFKNQTNTAPKEPDKIIQNPA